MEPEPCCLLATTEKGGAWRRGGHPVSSFPEVLRGFVLEARHACLLSDVTAGGHVERVAPVAMRGRGAM